MTITVAAAVKSAREAGLCVLPPREDGSKRPDSATWTEFQQRQPTADEMAAWYRNGRTGIGAVMGTISGNVELFEFDLRATYEAFVNAAMALGLGELVARIYDGLSEDTPGDGVHWFYRCAEIAGNTKLAERPGPPDALGRPTREALIETRGEGGYAVLAPSYGGVHPTGRPYTRLAGSFATIATITPDERAALWQLARSFDLMPPKGDISAPPRQAGQQAGGTRPGDDFAAQTTWDEILTPHGWVRLYTRHGKAYWRRPGKDDGWSATTNYANSELLYVFSSSTPFEPHRGYGKFGAFALLNHASDFRAAAHDLALRGYGSRPEVADEGVTFIIDDPDPPQGADEGARAGAADPRPLPILDAGDQDLPRIAGLAWGALAVANEPARLFRFGGVMARIERDDQGAPGPRTLTEDRLRHELARAATWRKITKSGMQAALPPVPVVKDLIATPDPPLPILETITDVPTFGPDGSLGMAAGYHAAGHSYYAPRPGFAVLPVPAEPAARDIERARALLLDELLGDFPFVGDPERAHAFALLILPFVRALINGPTPLHLIEKPTPGTGASLLADTLTFPATGRPTTAMTEGRDEDEWRKRITARLRGGAGAILIDNLRDRLETASLAAALTATTWEDRLLGTSDTVRLPVRCCWIATGNNPVLSGEIARRTIRIRLDARHDRPWLRRDFRHPDLREWYTRHRAALAHAALTLAQAWLAEGRPTDPDGPKLGMFEPWSRTIGGILLTAGIPGFLTNLGDFYDQTDAEGAAVRAFVGSWWGEHNVRPVGVADLYRLVVEQGLDLDLGDKSDRSQRIRLGRRIGEWRDRQYDLHPGMSVRIASGGISHHAQSWKLIPVGAG